jgi:hypothetical protein
MLQMLLNITITPSLAKVEKVPNPSANGIEMWNASPAINFVAASGTVLGRQNLWTAFGNDPNWLANDSHGMGEK